MGIISSDEEPCWSDVYNLRTQNNKLKAENEKLKALCDTYRTCYQAKHSDIKGLLFKYKQTLQEVKAIAGKAINWEYTAKSLDYLEGMEIIGHYVMQKISEAESEVE